MADKRLIPTSIRDTSTEALNELIDRLGTLDLTPLLIYIIDNVHASALPHLADQFHVAELEGWSFAQTDVEKRALIKRALELHRYKGTTWAIKKVFEVLSLEAEIQEWFQYDGNPYKFKVFLKSVIQDEDTYKKLVDLINEYKNVRSWLDSIGTHREHRGYAYYGLAAQDGKYCTIGIHVHADIDEVDIYSAMAQRLAMSTAIGVHNPTIKADTSSYYMAGAVRQAKYTIIGGANG